MFNFAHVQTPLRDAITSAYRLMNQLRFKTWRTRLILPKNKKMKSPIWRVA